MRDTRDVSEVQTAGVASPIPLGMSVLALATAVLGCVYAGFIVPFGAAGGSRIAVGVLLLFSGIVLILAGMWEFRKGNTLAATWFTAYGGFIAAIGLIFTTGLGTIPTTAPLSNPVLNATLGLLFLCWAIFNAVLIAGAMRMGGMRTGAARPEAAGMEAARANANFLAPLVLLFITFAFLTIGELAGFNGILLRIGGWFGIVTALVAWAVALASLTGREEIPIAGRF